MGVRFKAKDKAQVYWNIVKDLEMVGLPEVGGRTHLFIWEGRSGRVKDYGVHEKARPVVPKLSRSRPDEAVQALEEAGCTEVWLYELSDLSVVAFGTATVAEHGCGQCAVMDVMEK